MKFLGIFMSILVMCTAGLFASGAPELTTYTNEEAGFTLQYPSDFKEIPVLYPQEVARFAIQNDFKIPVVTVSIRDSDGSTPLEDIPQKVVDFMKTSMPKTSNYKIINEYMITLNDGSNAAIIEFSWMLEDKKTVMETASIITEKGGKQITITGNTIKGIGFPVSTLTKICKTLQFID